jgi:hypothetical protein
LVDNHFIFSRTLLPIAIGTTALPFLLFGR